jgi:hypothetical protein
MGANAYVYVDVAAMIWSYPLAEVNDYIKRLVQAGLEKEYCMAPTCLFGQNCLKRPLV